MVSTLIVAAHEPELEPVVAVVGTGRPRDVEVASIGIGLWAAAAGVERVFARCAPARCILVGSCGVYPQHAAHAPPGTRVVPSRVALADAGVTADEAQWVPSPPCEYSTDAELARALAAAATPVAEGAVLNTLAITTATAPSQRLGAYGEFENLEAYAVARACAERNIPFAALLGVTNVVGPAGRAQWRSWATAVAADVAHAVAAWLAVNP